MILHGLCVVVAGPSEMAGRIAAIARGVARSVPIPYRFVAMRIGLVTPAPPGTRFGNRVTALRWARILRGFGHRVTIAQGYDGKPYDLLVALHARRGAAAVAAFSRRRPGAPIVLALTGTDIYRDLPASTTARASIEAATRLVVLQPLALDALDAPSSAKARVILQSVTSPSRRSMPRPSPFFDVCVVGHLRAVKDPFRAAMAARRLPPDSRVRVLQAGGAMTGAMARRARAEMARNPRYRWLGERTAAGVWSLLASSRLFVVSSRVEGGASAVGEAIVSGVPVIASDIPGNRGLLGDDYPGCFPFGDSAALAMLMLRAERDGVFYDDLRRRVGALAPQFDPEREREAWARLLAELGG